MTAFIIDKIQPLKEIIPEAKINQIMCNLNIQFSIQYMEVEDNVYEWVLWNEDQGHKIMGVRTLDRDTALRRMAETISDVSKLESEKQAKYEKVVKETDVKRMDEKNETKTKQSSESSKNTEEHLSIFEEKEKR